MFVTCQNVVDLVHHQVGVLRAEAHGRLEFEHVAVGAVGAEEDVLFFEPGIKSELVSKSLFTLEVAGYTSFIIEGREMKAACEIAVIKAVVSINQCY